MLITPQALKVTQADLEAGGREQFNSDEDDDDDVPWPLVRRRSGAEAHLHVRTYTLRLTIAGGSLLGFGLLFFLIGKAIVFHRKRNAENAPAYTSQSNDVNMVPLPPSRDTPTTRSVRKQLQKSGAIRSDADSPAPAKKKKRVARKKRQRENETSF